MTISNIEADNISCTKALIITSSGGGGLLQAANAKEQELKKQDPNAQVLKKDLLRDWAWVWAGRLGISLYDKAQRLGDVKSLEKIINKQGLADRLFFPSVFVAVLKTLIMNDVDLVIDTQPICTSAILKAIRFYNRLWGKNVVMEKILVDLPTKKSTHFFQPIKELSIYDKKLLKLIAIEPLLEENETESEFWQKTCGLNKENIAYDGWCIRDSFKNYSSTEPYPETFQIPVKYHSDKDKKVILKSTSYGMGKYKKQDSYLRFQVTKTDKVMVLLLGSQPAYDATLSYIKELILTLKKSVFPSNFYLFVFCSEKKGEKKSLSGRILDLIDSCVSYPKCLTIVPMSFQGEETIAPLFYRSDFSITRSGGQTAMELMCVSRGEVWIHSEAKQDGSCLLKGIPGWEAGNAIYLQEKRGAKIVTPHTFKKHLEFLI